MKKLILGCFIITITLIAFFINPFKETIPFRHKCNENEIEDYSNVHIPISFMPGKEKCLEYSYKIRKYSKDDPEDHYVFYYRNLKEFIITKNNKYCLWGSKNWDEECQDAAMDYAYAKYNPKSSKSYTEFKQTVINFIKYVQANDIEKALALTHEKAMLFTDDQANCLMQEKYGFPGKCRAYFKQNSKHRRNEGEINLELFRENLMQIDADNIRFYLDDLTNRYMYSVVIPYEYKGTHKYFDIRFDFGINGAGREDPYDNSYYPKIYDLGIYIKFPSAHSSKPE